ncbi:MAG: acyltransferase [Rubricoccaceae bacterium]|nr:acyltransferase [Rubricoccaceae bacterium]
MTDTPPTSHVASSAQIGEGTTIGHFCVIADDVVVGEGCEIGHHVVLHPGTRVGSGVRIDDHATVGKQPMRSPASATTAAGERPPAQIGDRCLIGTGAVVYAGCTLGERVLVADLATIREEVEIGDYTIVGRGAAVENQCTVGRHCKLETNAYVTAYSVLEDRVFVAPGVLMSNDNFMGRTEERKKHFKGAVVRKGARLGVGAVLLPGKEVGPDAVVAAGAVLTRDAEGGTIYAGLPARTFREVPEEQKLENQGWDG